MAEKEGAGGKPQPYDTESGQYTGEEAKRLSRHFMSNNGSLRGYSQEGKGTSAASDTHKVPEAMEFGRIDTKRHQKHIKELGYKNEREYIKGAVKFFNSQRGTLYFGGIKSYFYRYEKETNLLAVCDREGVIHTFHILKPKEFDKTILRERLEWKK